MTTELLTEQSVMADQIREALREVFDERERKSEIDREMHKEHHEFIKECIPLWREDLDARKRKREFWEGVRKTAVGTFVVACVGGVLSALGWIGSVVLAAVHK